MAGYLAHVPDADNVRAKLLLDRQVPLHDVGLRIIHSVSADSAGKLVVDRRNGNGRGAL